MALDVLHILGTAQPEGTSMARVVRSLAQHLDPKRYRMHAWFLGGPGPLVELLCQAGVQAQGVEWSHGLRDPWGAAKFVRELARRNFAIVQFHVGGRAPAWLVRTFSSGKTIRYWHGRILEPQGLGLVALPSYGADAVVAVSQAVARQVADGRARVIYSGVDVNTDRPPVGRSRNDAEIVIGTAGRLIELKGIDYLLKAAAALRRDFPALRVEIAGSGPDRPRLELLAEKLGLGEAVTFPGWVGDLHSVLPNWDVFVLPSLEEGFPIAALDAMAAGVPVVASAVGGVPELIEDGKTGWLVRPRDVGALAGHIRLLTGSSEMRGRMGRAGYERVRTQFPSTRMARDFAQLYDELTAARVTA